MEQQEKSSGKALFESLRQQFQTVVPGKATRVLLLSAAALCLIGVVVGIVCGSVAIAKCQASPATESYKPEAMAVTAAQPGAPVNETVVWLRPTAVPTEAPTVPPATPVPETPAPIETETPGETSLLAGKMYKKGDTDELIRSVQSRLMELGYMDSDEPTDYFGNQTHDSLVCFQRHNDLLADGILGEATYALLISESAKEYVMQEGDEGDDVKEVQERLYELGYLDKNSRTSVFGEKTAAAVRAFQSANKIKVDGKVGSKTLSVMYSSDVVGNYYKFGDSDDSIIAYQKRLVKLGYLESSYECKGKMDSKTVSAIKTFQEANGLVRDGCLGPATMAQLNAKDAIAYALRLGMSGSDVKAAQQRLYKLGYLGKGQATGYFGESTVEAVKAFQKRNSLTQNGEINAKTLEKLNSDKAKAAAGSSSSGGKATPTPKPNSSGGKPTPTPKPSSSTSQKGVEKFISIAESKIGCKYVRGAKGPNSFDCSGFVYWCLNQAGIKQSYMTSIMWRTCTRYKRITSMSDIKRGDVLVFRGDSMATGHVGIYLGNGKMIDASSSRGQVRITDSSILKSKYWQERFLMAYRIWD